MNKRPFPPGFAIAGSILILFIILPVLVTLLSVSLQSLLETITDREVARSIGLTFIAAAIATSLGLLFGLPLAYIMARVKFPGKSLLSGIIDLPLIIPHTAAGIALLLVFGRQGILGGPLSNLGIFFTDRLGGIVVGMMFVSLPLLVNASREAFHSVNPELEHAARVDGANAWQVFWNITLPLAWRGILSGAITMWARGISEFGAVAILAYSPKIIPVLIYERFQGFGLSSATPVAALLMILVLIVFLVLRWLASSVDAEV
ncbi:MAG TPA: ABC transporter permease [Anaerolineaceae bacterium]|nr:ABC transporter permease [Anaerolineaceae bacterium]HOE35535.1 ABC transporter permease [Anaerolineaceae bacterium]HOT26411.1 ABC transporter permease [Anaerolineaceae bacterium]HQK03658.1 ABC transporter permease [Anaerolineaceae bacterium]HQM55501.1 ABC transporter permease [Anaerolineaceae bacterium]